MAGIAKDMEGGISTLLEEQKKLPGKLTVDFVRFDTVVEHVHKFAHPDAVNVQIQPRGGTALYDAVGQTVSAFGASLRALPEHKRPGRVIVAIVTDGWENSSREYTAAKVKEMVQHQTEKYGWNFTYLGANQDAVFVASTIGIDSASTLDWNTAAPAAAAFAMSNYVTGTRSVGSYTYTEQDRLNNS